MIKTKKLIIVGLSNNAKLAAFYFNQDTNYEVVGFSVNAAFINTTTFCQLPIFQLENLHQTHPNHLYDIFVAIGYSEMNVIRQNLYDKVKELGYKLPNYISPHCTFLTKESIGDNNFILEDNTIQPFVKIGSNNVFWSGNHIGHDVEIGNHNFITSHVVVSGFTKIKNNTFIGVNATLRDDITIEDKTLIAAGAIIMKNTEKEQVYLPAQSTLFHKKSTEIKIS
jgi:sugar O-acyltransferase (sialic acid O-acetyltransferase NeuD family)